MALYSPFVSAATSEVPVQFKGAGRRVHMGQAQLLGFMLPKMETHLEKHRDMYLNMIRGNAKDALHSQEFYNEYFAVMDLPAEFITQHCARTFVNRDLANGTLVVNGEAINPENITKTAILTVEGSKDDISCPGQTMAAHNICSGIPADQRYHYVQEGAGHYGCFEGTRFREGIAPRQASFIREIGEQAGLHYSAMPAERTLIEPARWQQGGPQQGLALVVSNT